MIAQIRCFTDGSFDRWEAAGFPGYGSPEHRAVFTHDYPPTAEESRALAERFGALVAEKLP